MVSRRKRYTREFKIETVKLITDGDNSVTQIAADMEIHPNTLYKWIRLYSDKPQEAFPGSGHLTSEAALVFHSHCQTRAQARQSIFDYIERFYNRKRIHSSLGYRTPYEVDQLKLAA